MLNVAEKVYEQLRRSSKLKEEADKQSMIIAQKLRLQKQMLEEAEYKLKEEEFITKELLEQEKGREQSTIEAEERTTEPSETSKASKKSFFSLFQNALSNDTHSEDSLQKKIFQQEKQKIQDFQRIEALRRQLQRLQSESISREEEQKG